MPKLNRFIVLSIIGDIKELICVANEMCSWVGKIEHFSWRFPTRPAKNVNAIELVRQHKGSAGEMYILLLELAYDRVFLLECKALQCWRAVQERKFLLHIIYDFETSYYQQPYIYFWHHFMIHFVLRLIIEFMDHYPFIEDFFKEFTNVKRPENMTLANMIHVLWSRLKTIPESISKNLIKSQIVDDVLFVGRVSRGSQASGSLTYCESCSCAGKMITELTISLDQAFQEHNMISFAASERDQLAMDIFDKTQWAVMNRLVIAIHRDVKTIFAAMRTSESSKGDFDKMMASLQMELRIKRAEVHALEAKNNELLRQMEIAMNQLGKLKSTQLEVDEKNVALAASFAEAEERISLMENWNVVSQRQIAALGENKRALEHTVEKLHRDISKARQSSLEKDNLQLLLVQLQNENASMKSDYAKRVGRLEQTLADLQSMQISAASNSSKSEKTVENIDVEEETVITPEDDPELDMTRQMVLNQETIDKLTRQNERLSKTLNRLREHQRIARVK